MKGQPIDNQIEEQVGVLMTDWPSVGDGPLLRSSIDESERQSTGTAATLADAFSEFILMSTRLETSYRELQSDIHGLSLELADRNTALSTSLAENERMRLALQQVVDSMPCGVLVVDREGKVVTINPESGRMLGLDLSDSATGQPTLRDLSVWAGIDLDIPFDKDLDSDVEQELCLRDKSGERWLQISKRRFFNGPGSSDMADQTILILRDITAQKRAERDREAGRKAMALAEITTILAHEIRNPLASLELFSELIEQDETRRGEWIANLRAGIRSLSGMVNNVLSFHSSGSLRLAPIQLGEVIIRALRFVQPLADQAAVSLEWLGSEDAVLVMGNESGLQQVVLNMIANAIRHTPVRGVVTVSLRVEQGITGIVNGDADANSVVLEFTDSGCGIREDQINHIFEPGFSGSGDTSGLGLAVCERIVKQHGGRLSVANQLPSGARFTIKLPICLAKEATA
jgi:signal transduction histidine kinase